MTGPADFIGLHFFSPVDKMALLEIIGGEQTSDQTSPAHSTSPAESEDPDRRQRQPRLLHQPGDRHLPREGVAMLAEGIAGGTVEQAAAQAGYPAPVLH